MTEKEQFDNFLGGSQELPSEAHILKLASARASEIAAMTYSIDNPQQTKRVFQKLPIHMRRRIMSHNAKRMPRRLREIHMRQMSKSGLPPRAKRPSRKYRRRPSNLVAEYKRRQTSKSWLETHVWHAKRFKMVDKWGYRLPDRSNNRCFRSSYRAVAKHCLVQDISYISCIEINGESERLCRTLNQHCGHDGLSFAAKSYARGNREGNVLFYDRNKRPVGHVQFIWRESRRGEVGRIWIWAHPSFYRQVLDEICESFGFCGGESSQELFSEDGKCRLVLLRDKLNRFRITGPLSLALLTDSVRMPERNLEDAQPMETEAERPWDLVYYSEEENRRAFEVQSKVFQWLKDLKSPSQLPPSIVMAFTVLDPRFFAPPRRTKAEINKAAFEQIPVPPTFANASPLWDGGIRDSTTKGFRNTSEINKLRSENLVPGVQNDLEYPESLIPRIPVIVVQKPGSRCDGKSIGFGSGIDVILPSGWANPFWISFILRCGKPGGLRESKSMIFENLGLNSADFNAPDTAAYTKEALEEKYALMEAYFRRPPNRRSNYIKLGISSPFYCQWDLLVREWEEVEKFRVARDKGLLNRIQEGISPAGSRRDAEKSDFLGTPALQGIGFLVAVKISILHKGCPKDFAVISIPTDEDLQKFGRNKTWSGPVAKILKDAGEKERKTLRRGHMALLRRLRRQRLRQRDNSDGETVIKEMRRRARSVVDSQAEKMRDLYLPECKTVRYSSDREVMGYVVKGDFSFTESKGIGLGYVAISSISVLIKRKSDLVLIRNTKSRQYRLARLVILM